MAPRWERTVECLRCGDFSAGYRSSIGDCFYALLGLKRVKTPYGVESYRRISPSEAEERPLVAIPIRPNLAFLDSYDAICGLRLPSARAYAAPRMQTTKSSAAIRITGRKSSRLNLCLRSALRCYASGVNTPSGTLCVQPVQDLNLHLTLNKVSKRVPRLPLN